MMRQNQHKNRQRSRGRGRGNGGGNSSNKVYDSNGPDVKVRGSAQNVADKYLQLGRDAHSSGDTIMAESYYQHAEHYLRIVAANQPPQPQPVPQSDATEDAASDGEVQNAPNRSNNRQERTERQERQERPERQERQNRRDNGAESNNSSDNLPGSGPQPEIAKPEIAKQANGEEWEGPQPAFLRKPVPTADVAEVSEAKADTATDTTGNTSVEEKPKRVRRPRKPKTPVSKDKEVDNRDNGEVDIDKIAAS